MSLGHIIDFLVVGLIVATAMLLFVFARYSVRCWRAGGWADAYAKMSFFNGLVFNHIGNLILLAWFWNKVHHGEISLHMKYVDTWILSVGSAIALFGVLYKVRVFTDSSLEVALTASATFVLSVLSLLALYFN